MGTAVKLHCHFIFRLRHVPGSVLQVRRLLIRGLLVAGVLAGSTAVWAQKLPAEYLAAEKLLAAGDSGRGRLLLQRLIKSDQPLPRAYQRLAESFMEPKEISKGIDYFTGLLRHHREPARAHAALAMLWNAKGKADSALSYGYRAVLGGAAIFPACEITVHLLRAQKQEVAFRQQLAACLQAQPQNLAAAYTLAYEAYADGRLADARTQLSTLQKQFPRDWRFSYRKAKIEMETLPMDSVLSTIGEGLAFAEAAADSEGVGCLLCAQIYCLLLKNDSEKIASSVQRLNEVHVATGSGQIKMLATLASAIHQQLLRRHVPAMQMLSTLRGDAARQHDGILAILAGHALGGIWYELGNSAESQHAYLTAKAIADSLRFSTLQLSLDVGLGYATEKLGLYHLANEHYSSAEREAQRTGSLYYLPFIWAGLARICSQDDKYEEAIAFHKKRLTLSRDQGLLRTEIWSMADIADCYKLSGNYAAAEEMLNAAWKRAQVYKIPVLLFNLRLSQGDLARHRGDYERAMKYYEQARAMTGAVGNLAVVASSLKIGELLLQRGDCVGAERAYRQAYAAVLQRVSAQGLERGALDLANSSQSLISLAKGLVHCGKSRDGFDMARQGRLHVLRKLQVANDRAELAMSGTYADVHNKIDNLQKELARLTQNDSANSAQQLKLQNQIQLLQSRLSGQRASSKALHSGVATDSLWLANLEKTMLPVPTLQKSLAEQKAVALFYLVGSNATLVFALHPDTLVAKIVRWDRSALRAAVARLNPMFALDRRQPLCQNVVTFMQLELDSLAARELMDELVNPLLLARQPAKLIIIPDDVLCILPFDALLATANLSDTTNASSNHLRLDNVPYLQLALTLEDIIPNKPQHRARALLMANGQAVKLAGQHESLPGLRLAVQEVQRIVKLLPAGSADLMCNQQATCDSFKGKAPDYALLHLAMHARLSDWSPEYAQLFFSAPKGNTVHLTSRIASRKFAVGCCHWRC